MIRFIAAFFFLGATIITYSQTMYLTGRPYSFSRNNAIKEVGRTWGFKVEYAGDDVVNEIGLDSLNRQMDHFDAVIAKTKGIFWLGEFYAEVDSIEILHNKLRDELRRVKRAATDPIQSGTQFFERQIILVEDKKDRFRAVVISTKSTKSTNETVCEAEFLMRLRKRIRIKNGTGCSMPYQFPENGIILK
jgi:hypothetical protein